MRDGRNLRKRILFAAAAATLAISVEARAQTPVPTLPPLPPLPAAGETATPVPTLPPTPTPEAGLAATPGAAVPAAAPAERPPAPTSAPAEKPSASESLGGLPSSVLLLLGVGVLVLVATLVVVLAVLLKKPVVINVPSRSAPPPPLPETPASDSEATHVASAPGPRDALPGRFVVDEGDQETEIRIFRTGPGDRVETTIGRDPGPPYRHVQLLSPSVSGKHAKLVFDRRSYSLINYSRTSPTRINGEEMEENASRRLVDNDRIEIGDVVMTYRED